MRAYCEFFPGFGNRFAASVTPDTEKAWCHVSALERSQTFWQQRAFMKKEKKAAMFIKNLNSAKLLFKFFVYTGFLPKECWRASINASLLTLICIDSLEFFVDQFR